MRKAIKVLVIAKLVEASLAWCAWCWWTEPGPEPWRPLPDAELREPVRPQPRGWSLEDLDYAAVTSIEEATPWGRAAVLWVVRTRMQQRWLTARAVVQSPSQFTPWSQPAKAERMRRRLAQPDAEMEEAVQLARAVFKGWVPDPTGGADHFHAEAITPYWAPALEQTVSVGGHVFYRRGER